MFLGGMPHARDFSWFVMLWPAPKLTKKVEVKVPTSSQPQNKHLRWTIVRTHFGCPVRRFDNLSVLCHGRALSRQTTRFRNRCRISWGKTWRIFGTFRAHETRHFQSKQSQEYIRQSNWKNVVYRRNANCIPSSTAQGLGQLHCRPQSPGLKSNPLGDDVKFSLLV